MSNETKACMLTEHEIETLINHHGYNGTSFDERIERMKYLNNRRKAFNEEEKPKAEASTNSPATEAANQAWPVSNG